MGLLDFLFGKKGEAAQPHGSHAAESGTGSLNFDPNLISRLKKDHASLLTLFGNIRRSYLAQDFASLQNELRQFRSALNLHLAEENFKFYAYLRKALSNNVENFQTMNAFWKEMQEIGKVVLEFLRKYDAAEFTPEMKDAFGQELEAIGAALAGRIQREERELYILYAPAN